MPTWVLLAEYLPLFVMLTAEFVLNEKMGHGKLAVADANHRNGETMEVKQ
jgi:hypothetical protein